MEREPDIYGTIPTPKRPRLAGCHHRVPCRGFTCVGSKHQGSRLTPWCRGGDDDASGDAAYIEKRRVALGYTEVVDVGLCDDCWCRRHREML